MSQSLTPSMRRSVLIAALRDEKLWPEGFQWNYQECETCGVGLYRRMTHLAPREWLSDETTSDNMARLLGIPEPAAYSAFVGHYGGLSMRQVTPAMVADRLETIHRELESAK